MKGTKLIYLLIALALPVLIFLFLKYFGKNQFDVAPLYQEAIPKISGCTASYQLPYTIPASLLQQLQWSENDSLTLIHIASTAASGPDRLDRIRNEFEAGELSIREIPWGISRDTLGTGHEILQDSIYYWKVCFLFLSEPNDLILVDNQRRIRGHYQLENREEIDRLMVEAKIILRKY